MKHTVYEHKLASGAKGLIIDVPGSEVVSLAFRFNSGFQFSDPTIYELPHVVEHLISCGTKAYPEPNAFKIEFEKNGAFRNAFTNSAINSYVSEFASFELDRILDLYEEYLTRPIFPEAAFGTEISNVRQELSRLTTEYGNVASNNLATKTFPEENQRYRDRIDQLLDISLRQVLDHYHRTHTGANMRFYIAGSFPDGGEAVVARLESLNARLPKGERMPLLRDRAHGLSSAVVEHETEIEQIYYRYDRYADDIPFEHRPRLSLVRILLLGGWRSRIYGKARERGLAYNVAGSVGSGDGTSVFATQGYATSDKLPELFKLIRDEQMNIAAQPIVQSELKAAQELVLGSSARSLQTPSDILSWYIDFYDRDETIYGLEEHLKRIKAVTPAEVLTMAEHVFGSTDRALSLVGPVSNPQARDYLDIISS